MSDNAKTPIISVFTEQQVERLTGIAVRRLRTWDRIGFFTPAFADENRRAAFSRIYSFTDVVSLRVLALLMSEHGVPLRNLRSVAVSLARMDRDAWHQTRLTLHDRTVILSETALDGRPAEAVGQLSSAIPLGQIYEDTRRDVAALSIRPARDKSQGNRRPAQVLGSRMIAGTRIPVDTIMQFAQAGYSIRDIQREYPTLTETDIKIILDRQRAA